MELGKGILISILLLVLLAFSILATIIVCDTIVGILGMLLNGDWGNFQQYTNVDSLTDNLGWLAYGWIWQYVEYNIYQIFKQSNN